MDYSSLIKEYLDDAEGHLEHLDTALIALEENGWNREIITGVLGALHTLKGNSAMMGFEQLKSYIHNLEGLLKAVLEGRVSLNKALPYLIEGSNVIRETLSAIEQDPNSLPDLSEMMNNLARAAQGEGPDSSHITPQSFSISNYLGTKANTIKVDFKRLDDLMNLVGELVIFKTRMNQIGEKIKSSLTGQTNGKSLYRELNEGLQLIGKTVSELQEGIMKIRMLPVRTVFSKFPRMVKDIARAQNKEVSVAFSGEDTELDKTVIDELGEPLLHIIRNAIDHGIETPEERLRAGKPEEGRLLISAIQESNYIVIKVSDDGKGIDTEAIRKKALEKNLISHDSDMTKEEILNLIFTAGFTTKDTATELSGRGIGLDVVSRGIAKLNGQILVESTMGKGTTFTIKLPLSLAIIPALMAETSGELYAIPMSAIEESIKVRQGDVHLINNREVIRIRDQVLPVIRLNNYFRLGESRQKKFYLVIVRKSEKRFGLAVDKLRGRQEIVIKPLDDTFGKSAGIAGASILGDGKIVLIIDTNALCSGATIYGMEETR